MMRRVTAVSLLMALLVFSYGTGWVGQTRLSKDGSSYNVNPCVAIDEAGTPWAIWHGYHADTSLLFSSWGGHDWKTERGVVADTPDAAINMQPSLAFDARSRAWLVWAKKIGNTNDIGSSIWTGTCWSPEIQVNLPDSTELDFMPKVACGGGQVWCVWYGGPTDMSPYSVYASRWNDDTGTWEPEMRVSPPDSTYHWWCDVAVDDQGTPHVVWCNSDRLLICYSYYDGAGWRGPTAVNDTAAVGATGWAAPRIVVDHAGVLHVCYTGVAQGATGRDIFYSRNDGTGWTPSARVTSDTEPNYNEWFSDIAADRDNNVWIAWDRQGEGTDQFRVYASHCDGIGWGPEERLDNDSAHDDGGCSICLDGLSNPWVLWTGKTYGTERWDIYWNRYADVGLGERPEHQEVGKGPAVHGSLSRGGLLNVEYDLPTATHVSLRLYDNSGRLVVGLAEGFEAAGRHKVNRGLSAPSGVYYCRLDACQTAAGCKIAYVK